MQLCINAKNAWIKSNFIFFKQRFVNKNKFSCSDDDLSESTTSPHLSSPLRLSSPYNDHNKDDDIVDGNDNVIDDDDDDKKHDKFEDYESFDSEYERDLNSLLENYELVSKKTKIN